MIVCIFLFINNRNLYAIAIFLLSCLFHTSAIFLMPSIIFIKRTNSKFILISIALASTSIILIQNFSLIKFSSLLELGFLPNLLIDKISSYDNSDFFARPRSINLMYFLFLFLYLSFILRENISISNYKTAVNISGMYFLYAALFSFSEDFSIRMSTYFTFGPILLLAYYVNSIFKNKLLKFILVSSFCLFLLRNIFFNPSFIMYQPYYNYIECLIDECQYSFDRYDIYKLNAK